jgi:hypothetical protein
MKAPKCPTCGVSRFLELGPNHYECLECGQRYIMTTERSPEYIALNFAEQCGFSKPEVDRVVADMRTPGTVAVWVKDRASRATLGILLNTNQRVVIEFDSTRFSPGELPQGGIATLLAIS